jgi:hypothetical protein
MIPTVLGVTAGSSWLSSICNVERWMSTKTGVAPATSIMFTVEAQVIGVVITSSPGLTPRAIKPMCWPPVAEESASAFGKPV